MNVCVRRIEEDHPIILVQGQSVSLGTEILADLANPRSESSVAVCTWKNDCCGGREGATFPFLSILLSCSNPVCFICLCAIANRCTPLSSSMAACCHELWLMLTSFIERLKVSLNRFPWLPQERLPCWSSPERGRWSGM